jgi:hypothetical protein
MEARAPNAACPRCGAAFRCGVADAVPCACTGLSLDAATLATLDREFSGCLCIVCLQALSGRGETVIEPVRTAPLAPLDPG